MNRAIVALMLLAFAAAAHGAGVGDVLPALEMKDAADQARVLDGAVRRIYFTPDRAAGEIVKAVMPKQAQLDGQGAVVIANIAEAPGFVKALIRRSLKQRPYATWLDVAGVTQPLLPARAGQVTVVELDQRRITAVRYATSAAGLQQELGPGP